MNKVTIGSSEIACIANKDPFKSIVKLWYEKKTGEKEEIDNIYVNRGNLFQPVVIDIINKEYELNVTENNTKFYKDNFVAVPDGFCKINDTDTCVEVKVTKSDTEYYEKYNIQLQWQMMCTDTKQGILAIFRDIFEPVEIKFIEYDDILVEELISKANEFLQSLNNDTCPYIELKINQETGEDNNVAQFGSDDLNNILTNYLEINKRIRELEKERDNYKSIISSIIKENTVTKDCKVNFISRTYQGYLKVEESFSNLLRTLNIPYTVINTKVISYPDIRYNKKGLKNETETT